MRILKKKKKIQTSGAADSSNLGRGLQTMGWGSGGGGQAAQCSLRTGITGMWPGTRCGMRGCSCPNKRRGPGLSRPGTPGEGGESSQGGPLVALFITRE